MRELEDITNGGHNEITAEYCRKLSRRQFSVYCHSSAQFKPMSDQKLIKFVGQRIGLE